MLTIALQLFLLVCTYGASSVTAELPASCAAITDSPSMLLRDSSSSGRKLQTGGECQFPVDAFFVMGERNSGTNYLVKLLRKNVVEESVKFVPYPKHWPITDHDVKIPPRTLILLSTRNPYDWLSAMRVSCYCCLNMMEGPLEEFVRKPYTMDPPEQGSTCPLTDVGPDGKQLRDMLAVRRAKLALHLHLGMLARPYFVHIRVEDLWCQEDPALWLRQRLANFCFEWTEIAEPLTADARGWVKGEFQLQTKFEKSMYFNRDRSCEQQAAAVQTINQGLHTKLEGMLGYSLMNC